MNLKELIENAKVEREKHKAHLKTKEQQRLQEMDKQFRRHAENVIGLLPAIITEAIKNDKFGVVVFKHETVGSTKDTCIGPAKYIVEYFREQGLIDNLSIGFDNSGRYLTENELYLSLV